VLEALIVMKRLITILAIKWEDLGRDKFIGNREELELAALRYLYIARANIPDAKIVADVENEFIHGITARKSSMSYNVLDGLIKKGIVEDPAGCPTSLYDSIEEHCR